VVEVPARIVGTEGDDVIRGTDGPDVIAGLGGNDRFWGLGGGDLICGVGDAFFGDPGGHDICNGQQDFDQSATCEENHQMEGSLGGGG
jgi:hypothetical protein